MIVILGILATVSAPSLKDMHSEAKRRTVQTDLGAMRQAISHYYLQAAATGGEAYPELDSVVTPGVVLTTAPPVNPFQLETNAPDSVVQGFVKGVIVGTHGGWAYKPSTGEIWPNTNTTIQAGGCGGPETLNENTW